MLVVMGVKAEAEDALKSVWEYRLRGFDVGDYGEGVERLMKAYEEGTGRKLEPGERGKVGLKVYTNSGPGLATPVGLVNAVVKALKARGFLERNIFLIDEKGIRLRRARYIPALSKGGGYVFKGKIPVYALDDLGKYWDEEWFYSSPLPSKEKTLRLSMTGGEGAGEANPEDKKSYLPMPLMFDVDFWINLPMVTSHDAVEVCGAMTNATLWNVSNGTRFWDNPSHAAVAVAEIAAIPELKERWVFTLMTLEGYQCIGGAIYNAYYTESEPLLWLSANPVALDYAMLGRINKKRAKHNLPLIQGVPAFFEYARQLKLGEYDPRGLNWVRVK